MISHSRIHCVVGGQFGSEAKGHVAAQLIKRLAHVNKGVINVRVGGSNAGHSAACWTNNNIIALRTIPIGALVDPSVNLVISAGSEIDPQVLYDEIDLLEQNHIAVTHRLLIDKFATIIEPRHIESETNSDLNERTGSTNKGIGAARADRLLRRATIARDYTFDPKYDITVVDTQPFLNLTDQPIVIEGTQGYGLGLHTDYYPQTTSGDCRAIDLLAQAGITPTFKRPLHVWLVLRTYPIRVAGNSGAMANELDWSTLHERNSNIGVEYTTVTKKVRRVAEWDTELARAAIAANGGLGEHLSLCLMFTDYIDPTLSHVEDIDLVDASALAKLAKFEGMLGQHCHMYGTSPRTVIWTDQ
jgi:adenylosuccinate synthase